MNSKSAGCIPGSPATGFFHQVISPSPAPGHEFFHETNQDRTGQRVRLLWIIGAWQNQLNPRCLLFDLDIHSGQPRVFSTDKP